MARYLLNSAHDTDTSSLCSGDLSHALTDDVGHHDAHDAFNHLYYVMLFIASLWFAGKLVIRLGMPALVGEIIFGIILGPHLLNLAGDEGSEFLIVIGEIGLVMLVVEAGIDVDVGMLKLIGPRGVAIAVFGSVIPMAFGFCMSYLTMGTTMQSSIAVGACFAPTSMGIALNVLKKAKILNTPTGQLIIASAILDDVIALMILSELQAMKDPTVGNILVPLLVSPILIIGIGYLAIRWIPKWIKALMNRIPKEHHENSILALLFLATFAFVPMCHFLGSSHLLGAFLAGLCFCTDHTIHHVWHHQIKRVLQWMLRVFFAATIGFAIPITEFTSSAVIIRGFVYCICGIGKVVTGFFARPLNTKEFLTVGFSMSAWGEFAFILATASFAEGTIDKESFSAVLLAVLLSVIYSPYALSFNIKYFEKKAQQKMDDTIKELGGGNLHPLYFAISTKAKGNWGHQDRLLKKLFNLNFEIIDFRSWHAPEYDYTHDQPLTKESFYVQDLSTALPPTKHLDTDEKERLKQRVKHIRDELREVLGEQAVVSIKRWLPGVTKRDDELDPTDDYTKAMFGGEYKPKHKKSAEYCRKQAFKQAHSMISLYERKSTLEDIAKRSRVGLYSMQSLSDIDRQATLKELGKLQSLTNLWDVASSPRSRDLSFSDDNTPKTTDGGCHQDPGGFPDIRPSAPAMEGHHTGSGHTGRAGGAGAVPVYNPMMDLQRHLEDDAKVNKKGENSMSYIYGDEDSQHHKLPEYSAEHVNEVAHFQPKLPGLSENGMDQNETSDQETDDNNGNKRQSNDTLVTFDAHDDIVNAVAGGHQRSSSSKLTIKVYPPALQAVASRSPVESDNGTPQDFVE